MEKRFDIQTILICLICIALNYNCLAQGCDLKVNAGPDRFTCDPSEVLQLNGNVNSNYPTNFEWVPATGLSDPYSLNPTVTMPPGKYKYKLKAETMSNELIFNGDFEAGAVGYSTDFNLISPRGTWVPRDYGVGDSPTAFDASLANCTGNGNFFIGKAYGTSGAQLWCQTIATKPGEVFLFKFKAQKYNKVGTALYLKAEANGKVLGESVYIPVCRWAEFSTCFVATSNSTTICITDSRGSTSAFGLDDISLIEKCKDEDEVEVEVVDLRAKLKAFPVPTCSSQEYTITALESITPKSPNLKYIWTKSNGGNIITNYGSVIKAKGSGTYNVKIIYTSNLGMCEDETDITIDIPDQLDGLLEVIGKANCDKDTFSLVGLVTSGTGSYTYNWSPASNIISGQGTPFAKAINPGKYSLKIVDINTGCDFIATVKVDADNSLPQGIITGDTIIDCTKSFVTLNSTPNDTSIYEWMWITSDQKTLKNISTIDIIKSGEVKLVITDKKSRCQDTAYWLINENTDFPKIDLGTDLSLDCKNTEFDVLPKQDFQQGLFIYEWKLPSGKTEIDSGLYDKKIYQSGKVYLKVKNLDNNCETLDSINVSDLRSNPTVTLSNPGPLDCRTLNVKINATTKSPNEKISWSTKNGNIVGSTSSHSIIVDKGGKFYIEVEDTIGHCIITDSISVIEDFNTPVAQINADTIFNCKDVQKTIDASGSSNYDNLKFIWSGNGVIDSGHGTNKIIVSSAGTYKLTIIDTTNGCMDTKQITINPDLNIPVAVINKPAVLNCKVTSLQLNSTASSTSGNTLKYSWTSAQNHPIGNSSTPTPDITKPGTYILTVEDIINGCSTFQSVDVGIDTLSPLVDLGNDQLWNCSTKDILLNIQNNTQGLNYSYNWSTNNGLILGSTNQKNITAGSHGTYRLTVIDQNNFCSSFKEINIKDDRVIPIAVGITSDILTCIKKNALLEATGSSSGSNMQYVWKNANGQIIGNTDKVSVSTVGKYTLEVMDMTNNCNNSDIVEVFENVKAPSIEAGQAQLLTCKLLELDLNGNIITPNNNYSIQWSTLNGLIVSGSNTLSPKVNQEGDYILTVTDLNNGCVSSDLVSVSKDKNVPSDIDFEVNNPKCVNYPGQLSKIKVSGGKPNYSFYLDGNQIDVNTDINVQVGNHQLKVIDDNGCEITDALTVIAPIPLVVDLKPEVVLFQGDPFVLTPQYSIPIDSIDTYDWNPSEQLDCNNCPYPKITDNQKDQLYSVTITDKNGCTATAAIRIKVEERGIWVPNVFSPGGDGVNDSFYPVVKTDSYRWIKYMRIFDRWGEMIWTNEHFEPNTPVNGWNGTFRGEKINPGVYVWILEVEWKNGVVQKLFGDVTLLK